MGPIFASRNSSKDKRPQKPSQTTVLMNSILIHDNDNPASCIERFYDDQRAVISAAAVYLC